MYVCMVGYFRFIEGEEYVLNIKFRSFIILELVVVRFGINIKMEKSVFLYKLENDYKKLEKIFFFLFVL